MDKLKLNPVRLYAIATSTLLIVAHYLPTLPTALYVGLVAAVLGVGGEAVRRNVTPNATAEKDAAKAYALGAQAMIRRKVTKVG